MDRREMRKHWSKRLLYSRFVSAFLNFLFYLRAALSDVPRAA